MKPTPELAQALTNLRVNDDFAVVLDFLVGERSTARDETESLIEGPKLWRSQGKGLFIRDFLKINRDAPQDLEKFKSKL